MTQIWKHFPGYSDVRRKAQDQSYEDDLHTLDALFGRDNLKFGDGPKEVKAEVMRQVEIEWRDERDRQAEFHVKAIQAMA